MRQCEFKKRYDPNMDKHVGKHIYGGGYQDIFKTVGKTKKKAVKKAVGEYVGMKAGDKIVKLLSKNQIMPNASKLKKLTQKKVFKRPIQMILSKPLLYD